MIEALENELDNARMFLNKSLYPDNWDGVGSKGYSHCVWAKTKDFLLHYVDYLGRRLRNFGIPNIRPGSDGSFDIVWRSRRYDEGWKFAKFDLLVNIPYEWILTGSAFGESEGGGNSIKLNSLDDENTLRLFKWIIERSDEEVLKSE